MTLTLWRGERLLGELWKRAPSPRSAGVRLNNAPTVTAFLIRSAPDSALEVRYEPERAAMALREAPPEAVVDGSNLVRLRRLRLGG